MLRSQSPSRQGWGQCSRSQARWLLAKWFLKMGNTDKCLMLLLPVQLLQSAVLFVKTLCLALFSLMVPNECFNPVSYSASPLSPFALSRAVSEATALMSIFKFPGTLN